MPAIRSCVVFKGARGAVRGTVAGVASGVGIAARGVLRNAGVRPDQLPAGEASDPATPILSALRAMKRLRFLLRRWRGFRAAFVVEPLSSCRRTAVSSLPGAEGAGPSIAVTVSA